jgi:hypothetical protein
MLSVREGSHIQTVIRRHNPRGKWFKTQDNQAKLGDQVLQIIKMLPLETDDSMASTFSHKKNFNCEYNNCAQA